MVQVAAEVLKLLVTALTAADALGPAAQQAVMDLLLPLLCEAAAGSTFSGAYFAVFLPLVLAEMVQQAI